MQGCQLEVESSGKVQGLENVGILQIMNWILAYFLFGFALNLSIFGWGVFI